MYTLLFINNQKIAKFIFKCFKQKEILTVVSGTKLNYPPEYFLRAVTTGENLDRWCTALVLYFVVERKTAFYSLRDIKFNEPRLSNNHSQSYSDFIRSMLNKNPQNRLNHQQINKYAWI